MVKRGFLLVILLLVSGCSDVSEESVNCVAAGCSGQVCIEESKSKDLFTTCEFREEYNCLKFSECGYFDGECKWKETEEYLQCLGEVKG